MGSADMNETTERVKVLQHWGKGVVWGRKGVARGKTEGVKKHKRLKKYKQQKQEKLLKNTYIPSGKKKPKRSATKTTDKHLGDKANLLGTWWWRGGCVE